MIERRGMAVLIAALLLFSLAPAATASPLAPSAPKNLVATAGDAIVHLTWDEAVSPVGVDRYDVYKYAGGSLWEVVNAGTDTSFTDTDVENGITYTYRVTAWNTFGQSDFSNSASATPQPAPIEGLPSAPTNFAGSTRETRDQTVVSLTWDPPADPGSSPLISYRIWRGGELIAELKPTREMFTDTITNNTGTIDYLVTAVNSAGEGARTDSFHVSTPCEWC